MLDDKDIKKLIVAQKEVFATGKEVEYLIDIVATKEEMKQGFDKIDKNLKKVFEVLKVMDDKLDDVSSVKHRVDYMETALNMQPIKK